MGKGIYSQLEFSFAALPFRITMDALAKEECVAGAVGDVLHANATVNEEDAVPTMQRTARTNRARAGVAAITAYPIETATPGRGGEDCSREFHDGFEQRIRRAKQDWDDLGLSGIPPSG